ncbi:MAG: DUF4003 family protein [Eggerthellaceae bacterium]|nr:DUF4003 family protein [Eggerthellaceae bacterium]
MRASLLERCEAQIRNETALRKGRLLEYESIVKLGAMLFLNEGREVDAAHIKECKRILKQKAGLFSNFRGNLQYIVQIKMALSDDPEAYIDNVMDVYAKLKQGRKFAGEPLAMTAATIYENCPEELSDEVIDKTREAYAQINTKHRFLTDESDMPTIALMIMAGMNPDSASDQAEQLFSALKDRFRIKSDVAQTAAMVLALSEKPASEKVEDFIGLFEACKEAGHATAKDKAMCIYATYADLDADRATIVSEIGEVDEWLKGHKGYGALGVGASMRRLIAATLVLEDYQASMASPFVHATRAVTQAIVEELVLILISVIICTIIITSAASSTN